MHDAEAVGDERVRELRELTGELGALGVDLGGLARVEPHVLQEGDLAVGQRLDRGLRGRADEVLRERDVLAEQLAQAGGDGRQGVLRVRRALGAAQVGQDDDARTGVGQPRQRGQGGADAAVVGDLRTVEGHVEVGADQDALAAQVAEGVDGLHELSRSGTGRQEGRSGFPSHDDVRVRRLADAHADVVVHAGERAVRASRRRTR